MTILPTRFCLIFPCCNCRRSIRWWFNHLEKGWTKKKKAEPKIKKWVSNRKKIGQKNRITLLSQTVVVVATVVTVDVYSSCAWCMVLACMVHWCGVSSLLVNGAGVVVALEFVVTRVIVALEFACYCSCSCCSSPFACENWVRVGSGQSNTTQSVLQNFF